MVWPEPKIVVSLCILTNEGDDICKYYNMTKEITMEKLTEAIIKTKREVMNLTAELEKVKAYLREQHKLKNQIKNK